MQAYFWILTSTNSIIYKEALFFQHVFFCTHYSSSKRRQNNITRCHFLRVNNHGFCNFQWACFEWYNITLSKQKQGIIKVAQSFLYLYILAISIVPIMFMRPRMHSGYKQHMHRCSFKSYSFKQLKTFHFEFYWGNV